MNAENPVQIDLFGASAAGTKDTRLAEHNGGSRARRVTRAESVAWQTPACVAGRACLAAVTVWAGEGGAVEPGAGGA